MTETREKFIEAKFFFDRMVENQSVRDAFKFNLSAFLSAARSVTLFMQKEYHKVSGFKEWYIKKQDEMGKDPYMKLLDDKRDLTIHQHQVEMKGNVKVEITETIGISDSVSFKLIRQDGTVIEGGSQASKPPNKAKNETRIEWLWYFNDLPGKDIVALSKEHLEKLEKLIIECESLFKI